MKARIRVDGMIEAIHFGNGRGVSHGLAGHMQDRWWAWPIEGEGPRWVDHPDPDGMWARYIAARLQGIVQSSEYLS